MGGFISRFWSSKDKAAVSKITTEPPDHPKDFLLDPGKTVEIEREEAYYSIGIDTINRYNYAFVGNSGVGKSSLINALRGLRSQANGAAKTGVSEETSRIWPYPHQLAKHVILWDITGCSAQTVPASEYFQNFHLKHFDCLIVVLAEALQELDLLIGKTANELKIRVIYVRSKSDISVRNSLREGNDWDESLEAARASIFPLRQTLDAAGLSETRLFLVSALVMQDMMENVMHGNELKTKEHYGQREEGLVLFDEIDLFKEAIECVHDRASMHGLKKKNVTASA